MGLIKFNDWQKVMAYLSSASSSSRTLQSTTSVSKKLDIAYSHLIKIIKELKIMGFITVIKNGRTNEIALTEEGAEVGDNLLRTRGVIRECQKKIQITTGIKL